MTKISTSHREFYSNSDLIVSQLATLVPGHGIASGRSQNSPYPGGSIEMQMPFFQQGGVDLTNCFLGTLNLSIAPSIFDLYAPEYRFQNVNWTNVIPPENFSLTPCQIVVGAKTYDCWVYYHEPETKVVHFQSASMIEVIAPYIDGIESGSQVQFCYLSTQMKICK